MKVVWSPLALARLREAAAFIARDKPGAAARWAAPVFEAVELLADLPGTGRVVPELGREDVRELLHGHYRLLYRITDRAVLVLTVRHGARRWEDGEPGGSLLDRS